MAMLNNQRVHSFYAMFSEFCSGNITLLGRDFAQDVPLDSEALSSTEDPSSERAGASIFNGSPVATMVIPAGGQ